MAWGTLSRCERPSKSPMSSPVWNHVPCGPIRLDHEAVILNRDAFGRCAIDLLGGVRHDLDRSRSRVDLLHVQNSPGIGRDCRKIYLQRRRCTRIGQDRPICSYNCVVSCSRRYPTIIRASELGEVLEDLIDDVRDFARYRVGLKRANRNEGLRQVCGSS